MEKLVILDYNTLEVHIYDVAPEVDINEEYISNLGFHTSECAWMFSECLGITYHKKQLA